MVTDPSGSVRHLVTPVPAYPNSGRSRSPGSQAYIRPWKTPIVGVSANVPHVLAKA